MSLLETDIAAYLEAHQRKDLLRFITCGSVDDGKSTLIGRLLYESKLIFDDQLAALEAESKVAGTQGGELDLALLVDGLAAEREQGITIDVAYRFFTTDRRKFIVADTPGHEQYTRNMVTGASTADVAVLLVDARKGLTTQTRRHATLVGLLGISTVALAVNKMDAVDWSQDVADGIAADFAAFARLVGIGDITVIPMSALRGDNVVEASTSMPWYGGPSLLGWLEEVPVTSGGAGAGADGPLRLPVQWVSRPSADFRGFAGQLVRGSVRPGDRVRVLPGGQTSTVARIVTFDGDLDVAVAGQSVTLTLDDEIDVSRGDVLAAAADAPQVADRFDADVVWMDEQALLPGRSYLLKAGSRTVGATLSPPRHRLDVDTATEVPARTLALNEIGRCEVSTDRPLPFDPYQVTRDMGGFVLIDRLSNATVAAGMVRRALRSSENVYWQALTVDKAARSALTGQRPAVVWFTGLSGAGKSTIADLVEKRLHSLGRLTYTLDGDNIRHGLNRDLGFEEAERVENIRRVAEVARLMVDAGLLVLVSFISPFRAERALARGLLDEGEFVEVHVDTPLEVAEARDPKGLYAKARRGELANFTGIDSPYEAPTAPELRIDTTALDPAAAADAVVALLVERGLVPGA